MIVNTTAILTNLSEEEFSGCVKIQMKKVQAVRHAHG